MDLVTVKPKINKRKVIICSVLALFVIGLSIFGAIMLKTNVARKQEQIEHRILSKEKMPHVVTRVKKEFSDKTKENIKSIYHSEPKRVFLTFDDGPSKTVTPFILDTLKEKQVTATFFVLGSRVELAPDLVKREYQEGHYIANHGYSHVYDQIYASAQSVLDEYNTTENAIKNALGDPNYASHVFRFPGGSSGGKHKEVKLQAIQLLEQNNVSYLNWNALTADSAGKHTKEEMLEYVKQTIGDKNSVVILMHDAGDKILTAEILPELIEYLKNQGYQFENIYDIL